jgi:molybdate transport system substrate-binding protein
MNILTLFMLAPMALVANGGFSTTIAAQDVPVIAAAADLQFALKEIAAQFQTDTGREVRLSFGASGELAGQLQRGAPFEMFMSADEGFVQKLADASLTLNGGSGAMYAEGRIVLFAPKGSALKVDAKLDGLRAALANGRIQRFAIANPEQAPYGRAAQQVLQGQGLWDTIRPKLVLGENVSQAAQFATSGSAQGGIFAYSLALSPSVSGRGSYALLPSDWHGPVLYQRMVLMKNAGETAQAFYRYMQTPPARTVFRKYGFVLPGEPN